METLLTVGVLPWCLGLELAGVRRRNVLAQEPAVATRACYLSGRKEARWRRAYWLREPMSGSDSVCSVGGADRVLGAVIDGYRG
jgi:hypothetical protein